MKRRMMIWSVVTLLLIGLVQPLAHAAPVTPTLISGTGGVGSIYVGATPSNVNTTYPVLLFVHGKGSSASTWWGGTTYHGTNDMYTYAYNNGYRTAFVNLAGDRDMWYNGSLLASKLDTIRNYFGVSKVTIVAHSKGGVDSNAASAHYGASGKISRVITLGSPHWGTPLADMAYSSWTWWLAALFGQRDEATYSLQTGYMSSFRSQTDGLDPSLPYYTLSGYKCGPVFSALWYGCMAISGEDDGLVPVWSARKPGATHLKEGYWDHDEIKMGSRTWSYFSPYIRTASLGNLANVLLEGATLAQANGRVSDAGKGQGEQLPEVPGNVILRGGEGQGSITGQPFPVESGVKSVTFAVYASSPDFKASMAGPDGTSYPLTIQGQVPASEVFAGTWVATASVTSPGAGDWQIQASAPAKAGYLMIASLDSDLKATMDLGNRRAKVNGKHGVNVGFAPGRAVKESKAEAAVSLDGAKPHGGPAFTGEGNVHRATVDLPAQQGVQNVTVTLRGLTADGSRFERTLVSSVGAQR